MPLIAQIEEVPDPRAEPHQRDQDQPAILVAVREGEVVADHGEQHRQREVVVVDRPLLAAQPGQWFGLASG